jgi:hypothetical protein
LLDLAGTCVFAKQSLGPILCDLFPLAPPALSLRQEPGRSSTGGTPSPEVTGSFCRVPSPQFTRAPEASRLAYVCPFPVRAHHALPTEAFPGSRLGFTPEGRSLRLHSPLGSHVFYPVRLPTGLDRDDHRPAEATLLRPPCGSACCDVVQECSPAFHRLRLSASP